MFTVIVYHLSLFDGLCVSLETRFLRADLIEVFEILGNVDPEKFFQVVRDDGRMLGRGSSFRIRCEEWNGLDDDVIAMGSVNAFKKKLDYHLRNVRGYF